METANVAKNVSQVQSIGFGLLEIIFIYYHFIHFFKRKYLIFINVCMTYVSFKNETPQNKHFGYTPEFWYHVLL